VGSATAQPRRYHQVRRDTGWLNLADVGTHRHDAEDYVNVAPMAPLESVQLRARDGAVAMDGVRVQFADGRSQYIDVHRNLRPGEALTIQMPQTSEPVKTLVLDYGNQGPYWRARETAHVQVLGLVADREDGRHRGDRMRGDRYRDDNRHDRDRVQQQRPERYRDANGIWRDRNGIEIRGGVQVQIR
jgi:hypothetical protein